jgi:hypothetical protein
MWLSDYERKRRARNDRRKRGLCIWGACPNATTEGRCYCDEHRAHAKRRRELVAGGARRSSVPPA